MFTWLIHGNLDVTLMVVFCRSFVKVSSKFRSGVEVFVEASSKFCRILFEVLRLVVPSVGPGRQDIDKTSTRFRQNFDKLWDPWEREDYHASASVCVPGSRQANVRPTTEVHAIGKSSMGGNY